MVVLKNETYLLEHKLVALQQLKTVNQLQSLTTLQKAQTLDKTTPISELILRHYRINTMNNTRKWWF
jgi:hypothetical protein